ncbi:protein TolB [Gemmatimonadetes bacterium T265]|nr:protein TolB [Gemmatimonadetes bacterium T265]
MRTNVAAVVPRSLSRALVALTVCTLPGAVRLAAQDTTRAGVSVRLAYDTRTRPTLLVPPVPGPFGDSVTAILRRDLDFGDRVTVGDAIAADAVVAGGNVDYSAAARAGAAGVVRATVTGNTLHLALYDVSARRTTATRDVTLPATAPGPAWRLTVHAAADEAERWATGVRGISATRVLFVRDGRIWSADSDGENVRALTGAGALSPAWLPDVRGVVYSTLDADGAQRIVIRTYDGGLPGPARTIAAGGVLNLTPAVSPDGQTVAYAHGEEDGTDLYAVPMDGGTPRRMTVGRGTDNVSPAFAPDGRRVVFTSGRSGHPEVYIADADGTNAELLTDFEFSSRNYRSNPSWSPDGRLVAFQSLVGGRFQLCTIEVRGRTARCLSTPERTEDPSWAPDSRHLVATATRGAARLVVLDAETGRARTLVAGRAPRMPAWSPPLR